VGERVKVGREREERLLEGRGAAGGKGEGGMGRRERRRQIHKTYSK